MSPSRPSVAKRLAFSAVVVTVVFGGAELAVRLLAADGPATLIRTPLAGSVNHETPEVFRDDPDLYWTLRPGLRITEGVWRGSTDESGRRVDPDAPPSAGGPRVLCLGDSCTFGLGLGDAQTWPALLAAAGDLDVVNAGVPGYSTYQGVLLLDRHGEELRPDVLVVGFGHNDARPWPTRTGNGWACLSDRQRAEHLRFASSTGGSALVRWIAGLLTLPDSEHVPGAAGLPKARARVSPVEFRENLRTLAGTGVPTVFLAWPRRKDMDPGFPDLMPSQRYKPYRDAVLAMESETTVVVNVEQVYRAAGVPVSALFLDDAHPSVPAARLVAEAVRRAVTRLLGR